MITLVFNIGPKDANALMAENILKLAGLNPFFGKPQDRKTPKLMVEVEANSNDLIIAKRFLMNPEFNKSEK